MGTKMKIPSAAKAKKCFQDKMSFTTGPVELEQGMKQGQPVNIVDVQAAEDIVSPIDDDSLTPYRPGRDCCVQGGEGSALAPARVGPP